MRIQRSFGVNEKSEKIGLLKDRQTLVLVSSGGVVKGQASNQYDFLTPYLRVIHNRIGIRSIDFIYLGAMARGEAAVSQSLKLAHAQLADALVGV